MYVSDVQCGSQLAVGDVLLAVNELPVEKLSREQVLLLVATHPAVTLTIARSDHCVASGLPPAPGARASRPAPAPAPVPPPRPLPPAPAAFEHLSQWHTLRRATPPPRPPPPLPPTQPPPLPHHPVADSIPSATFASQQDSPPQRQSAEPIAAGRGAHSIPTLCALEKQSECGHHPLYSNLVLTPAPPSPEWKQRTGRATGASSSGTIANSAQHNTICTRTDPSPPPLPPRNNTHDQNFKVADSLSRSCMLLSELLIELFLNFVSELQYLKHCYKYEYIVLNF